MKTVGAYEAKTHLPRLLEDVRRGEHITITKHGIPIARIVPMDNRDARSLDDVVDQIRALRRKSRLDGLSVDDLKTEGRR